MRPILIAAAVVPIASVIYAMDLTMLEFPSDDEIVDAYQSGEISDDEFYILTDTDPYSRFSSRTQLWDGNLRDRTWYFDSVASHAKYISSGHHRNNTRLIYRYASNLTTHSLSRYRLGMSGSIERYSYSAVIDRDVRGSERCKHRSLSYQSAVGSIRNVTIGNFAESFGLGTVFGTRGKLLGRSRELDAESFLVPDYSGGNGVYAAIALSLWQVSIGYTTERDTLFLHSSGAMHASRQFGNTSVWITSGISRLSHRQRHGHKTIYKLSLGGSREIRGNTLSGELMLQKLGRGFTVGGGIVEGSNRQSTIAVRYSAWAYSDSFVDDAAGSTSGPLRHTWFDDIVGIGITTRRSGCEGGIVHVRWEMMPRWNVSTTVLSSFLNEHYGEHRFAASVEHRLTATTTMMSELLLKSNERPSGYDDPRESNGRIGVSVERDTWSARWKIGVLDRRGSTYVSCRFDGRIELTRDTRLEWWLDARRVGVSEASPDYCYAYAQLAQQWSPMVASSLKAGLRYDSNATNTSTATLTANVEVSL